MVKFKPPQLLDDVDTETDESDEEIQYTKQITKQQQTPLQQTPGNQHTLYSRGMKTV